MGETLKLLDRVGPLRQDLNISESSKAGGRRQNRNFFFELPLECCLGLHREPLKFVLGARQCLCSAWDPQAGLLVRQMYFKYLLIVLGRPWLPVQML